MPEFVNLLPGDPAPTFRQRSFANPRYAFDTAAGRYIVMAFYGSAGDPNTQARIKAVMDAPNIFNDKMACFFGVSNDPSDETEKRVQERYPGYRFFYDFDLKISKLYGAVARDAKAGGDRLNVRQFWTVIDPTLRVLNIIPFEKDLSDAKALITYMRSLPEAGKYAGIELQAPILFLPNVFEPDLCQQLINLYETGDNAESGFMRQVDGKTRLITDHNHKRRRDHIIKDQDIIAATQARVLRRIVPEIKKVHQFEITRMERYIVACYRAEDEAHFRPHRDNTTSGTAHRRFAVTINLNNDFEGGELCFPEYGNRTFKPPPGGAVVFSCSLLHTVSKVTRGHRYAFLPFLYDDAAAKIREANNKFLSEEVGAYKSEEAKRVL